MIPMKKLLQKLNVLIPTKRRIIQLYCAVLFNANFKGFTSGNIYKGDTKKLCAPGINCYSCPGAVSACPLGSLQGSFSADRSTLYYVAGILFLYAVLFGRMICGWFCPFGLVQELLYKLKTPKLKKSPITRALSYLKYVILVFFVLIVPIAYACKDMPLPAFCKYICPAGTLEGGIGLLSNKVNASYFSMLGPLFTWKFVLMVSILTASVFVFRLFCRFLCPLGALYGLFNRFSFFGISVERSKCTGCNLCISHCKMDIAHVGDQECISCGDCVDVCKTGAIHWKGPKIFLRENESLNTTATNSTNASNGAAAVGDNAVLSETIATRTERRKKQRFVARIATGTVMLALLVGVIVYYWRDAEPVPPTPNNGQSGTGTEDPEIPLGNTVGSLCYGYDLTVLTQAGEDGTTFNPTTTGKISVINFWGTWCTPCVGELPYFDAIANDYADDVVVTAIHSNMAYETAPEFIGKYYPESRIVFAYDYSIGASDGYYSTLGGRGTYPYTVILDADGVIAAIFVSSVEYEDLQEVIEELLR